MSNECASRKKYTVVPNYVPIPTQMVIILSLVKNVTKLRYLITCIFQKKFKILKLCQLEREQFLIKKNSNV